MWYVGLLLLSQAVSSTSPQSPNGCPEVKKWNITVCAMLRDAFPYALEWIEFHRLQGVDHFVLYDDNSQDDTDFLPLLYETAEKGILVELLDANFFRGNRRSDHGSKDHDYNQRACLQHCHARYKKSSSWMLIIDLDEFIYSPKHGTLWELLKLYDNYTRIPPDSEIAKGAGFVSEFRATAVRYGTSGLQDDFHSEIAANASDGSLTILSDIQDFGRAVGSILGSNPRRAPHPELDLNYNELFNQTCRTTPQDHIKCQHALGKSVFKPERCSRAYIHWCAELKGESVPLPLTELRIDHFAWRSAQGVSKLTANWQANKIATFAQLDQAWFSRMPDWENKKFIEPVKRELRKFRWLYTPKKPIVHTRPKWLLDQMEELGKNLTFSLFQ